MENQIWFPLHYNALAYRSVLFKVKTLEHLLASGDFYVFPRMKSKSNWECSTDAINSIKNVTEELKRLSQMAPRNVFNNFTVTGKSV